MRYSACLPCFLGALNVTTQ